MRIGTGTKRAWNLSINIDIQTNLLGWHSWSPKKIYNVYIALQLLISWHSKYELHWFHSFGTSSSHFGNIFRHQHIKYRDDAVTDREYGGLRDMLSMMEEDQHSNGVNTHILLLYMTFKYIYIWNCTSFFWKNKLLLKKNSCHIFVQQPNNY